MNETPLMLTAFGLAFLGLTGLCLAMDRHYRQWRPGEPPPGVGRRCLFRWGGWLALTLSAGASVIAWDTGTGLTAWFGVLSGTAILLVGLLTYAPHRLTQVVTGAAMLVLVPLVAALGGA